MQFATDLLIHSPDGETSATKLLQLSSQTKQTLTITLTLTDTVTLTLTLTLNLTLTIFNRNIHVHFVDTHKKVFRIYKSNFSCRCMAAFVGWANNCTTYLLI